MSDDTRQETAHWAARPRYARSTAPPVRGPRRPTFARFAAAMDAARVARSPQLKLYRETPPYRPLPAPRADSRWRVVTGPVVRWLGIGACVLLFGLLLATLRTQPIGATIERLIAPLRTAQQDQETIPAVDRALPERAAERERPPLASQAVLPAGEASPTATLPGALTPTHPVFAPAGADTHDARPAAATPEAAADLRLSL